MEMSSLHENYKVRRIEGRYWNLADGKSALTEKNYYKSGKYQGFDSRRG
jgi:hypothetical protein